MEDDSGPRDSGAKGLTLILVAMAAILGLIWLIAAVAAPGN